MFIGDRPVAAFDWDSLCKVREPFIAGFTAHAFCADFSVEGRAQAPNLEEAKAFVLAYEEARGRSFRSRGANRMRSRVRFLLRLHRTMRSCAWPRPTQFPGHISTPARRTRTPALGALNT